MDTGAKGRFMSLIGFMFVFWALACSAQLPALEEGTQCIRQILDTSTQPSKLEEQRAEEQEVDLAMINKELKAYGTFLASGMNASDYARAMGQEWMEILPIGQTLELSIDLTKQYSFAELETFMWHLARYDGVRLHIIGMSASGRNIYSLSIDFQPRMEIAKPTLLFSGQIHGNEFAGSVYILKQFSEIVKAAQNDQYIRSILEQVRFVAIPILNPDSREQSMAEGTSDRRSNTNGVDLNRNFPSVSASQLAHGITRTPNFATKPGTRFYTGPSLGSEPETQAAMKWLETFVPSATLFLDYHQQGRGLYFGKPWDTNAGERNNKVIGQKIISFLNKGVSSRLYFHIPNQTNIGFDGTGGTITDYALSIARGLQYSPKYGILTLNVDGEDTPLLKFKDLDDYLVYYNPANANFCTATVEITRQEGLGNPLGYSLEARRLMNEEYYKHNYDKLLLFLAELALGMK